MKNELWKIKHGMYGTRTYNCWRSINKRCYTKTNASYKRYGAKGITVCKSWREDFRNFLTDMGAAPTNKHTVERLNSKKNYTKTNCVWATMKEQSNNTSWNKTIVFEYRELTYAQWEERLGFPMGTISQRKRMGWDDERILTTPVRRYLSKKQNLTRK